MRNEAIVQNELKNIIEALSDNIRVKEADGKNKEKEHEEVIKNVEDELRKQIKDKCTDLRSQETNFKEEIETLGEEKIEMKKKSGEQID